MQRMTSLTLGAGQANLTEKFLGYPQCHQIHVRILTHLRQQPFPSIVCIIRIHPTAKTQDKANSLRQRVAAFT